MNYILKLILSELHVGFSVFRLWKVIFLEKVSSEHTFVTDFKVSCLVDIHENISCLNLS